MFSDHMVLQRDLPVPVWGTAAPGDTVMVSFRVQKRQTQADHDGKWQAKLDPLKAGEAGVLTKETMGVHYLKEIRKFRPYAIRGVLWDQGEAGTALEGVDQFTAMCALVAGWRKDWGQGDFPFLHLQKPMGHTVWEARQLTLAARKHGVMTQMGNQGHSGEGTRLVREWVQAGLIGPVREVHAWSDHHGKGAKATNERPTETPPVPETLDWNLWLGVAPERPYHPAYVPFNGRGWWDFGSCALGDMGCHVLNAGFWALDLKYPTSIEAETAEVFTETGPAWSIITWQFPARGNMPPVKVMWYDGKKPPPRPKELEDARKLGGHGLLVIGEKGTIHDPGAYCQSPRLIPEAKMQDAMPNLPPKTIPRIKGSHDGDWIQACKGGPKPGSNFVNMLAGPLDMNNGLADLTQAGRVDQASPVPSMLAGEAARTLIVFSGATIIPDIPENYRTHRESYKASRHSVTKADTLRVKLAPGGGACVILRKTAQP